MYDIVLQILTFDAYISKNYDRTLEQAKSLLSYQQSNVTIFLKKLCELKPNHPVGIDIKEMAIALTDKMAQPQVFALINLLASLGMLELRFNDSLDITSLGVEYVLQTFRR